MNEKLIEKKFKNGVKKKGGLAVKFTSPFFTGMPDRLVLMPGRIVHWAELKTTGKELSPRQKVVRKMLTALGFPVWVIDGEETLNEFLNEI
ncbi:MAG TPA: VRR-NUC domain-containing protein [Flavisolibacter sp.]|jgi:hypothetical protein